MKAAAATQAKPQAKSQAKPQAKPQGKAQGSPQQQQRANKTGPCPWLCDLIPTNVPDPGHAQPVLHPRKDVFVLKVAKIGINGDRRCKMELELVTPKGPERKPPFRIDTRETQYEPDPPPCCCMKVPRKKR